MGRFRLKKNSDRSIAAASIRPMLAIDPGLNSMGWAYWNTNRIANKGTTVLPTRVGLLKAPRKLDLAPRALWLARTLQDELEVLWPSGYGHDIICEYPAWHGQQMGWAAGDLQKLVFLVGVLAGYFSSSNFTPVTPGEWKGQLPKSVVIRRLIKRFGPARTADWEKDVWDAVGIGLWKLGKF